MATLVLGVAGAAIGGAILGVSAATIGGFVGSAIGSVVDSWIISSLAPTQRIEGPRLDSLRITSSTEGAVIPRVYGRMRMGGNIVWATDFREEINTTTQGGGKGGGGGKVQTTEYLYYASFAVAVCEGPITGIGRIWADGKLLDTAGITWRWYPGDETQTADPFISAKMGASNTPAYRGTAYVVFEELALSTYGNRLPQLSFELFRPLADPDTAEGLTRAVTMIPASGEFTYATQAIRKTDGGATVPENLNALADSTDMVEALDRLQAMAPAVESVSLVVAWFGDVLRAGSCKVRPGVEVSAKSTTPASWSVNGVSRANAFLVSRDDQDRPVYGGTPSDFAVVQAIQEMKARGLRVTFYPFILMDVPPGNALPNPYSENAAETGQPGFPWRGRITCSPAAGYAGTVDKTATAASQVAALFGAATPASFNVSGQSVSWTGPSGDWGLRRMVLHYAHLCAAAGGVAIDTGYEAPAVYSWSRAQGFAQVSPVKGVEGFNRSSPVSGPTFVDATEGGKRLRRGARLWTVAVSTFKAETYRFLRLARPTEEEMADGAAFPPGSVHLPHWVENEWLKQFVAEQLVTVRTKRGFARLEWQKLRERNEALDCRVWSEATRIDLRVAEVANPRPGDRIEIDGDAFLIQGEPVRDRERLVWTVDLRPA